MWTAALFHLFWSCPHSCVLGKMSVNVFTKTILVIHFPFPMKIVILRAFFTYQI